MDKQGILFLTVKISVVLANQHIDIAQMTLNALNNKEEDSDDEQELGGGELMDTFTHFYSVLKDKGDDKAS